MRAIHLLKWRDAWPLVAIIGMQLFLNLQLYRMMEQARANEREMSRRVYQAVRGHHQTTNTYEAK